jgi:hypothetical protein
MLQRIGIVEYIGAQVKLLQTYICGVTGSKLFFYYYSIIYEYIRY